MKIYLKADRAKISAKFFMLPVIVLLTHCGPQIRDNREYLKDRTLVDLAEVDHRYFLQDEACQNNTENSSLFSITESGVEQWTNVGLNYFRVQFEQTISQFSLKTPDVFQFNYGGKYTRSCFNTEGIQEGICLNANGNIETNYIAKDENLPKPLKVCRDNFEYSMESYEGVALTTLHTIHRVYKVFQKLNGVTFKNLSPIEVDVLPIYETNWYAASNQAPQKLFSKVETDNLFYLPKNDKAPPKIVVVPEPSEATDKQSRYWAMPFAVAHELGHHFHRSLEKDLKVFSPVSLNLGQEFHRYMSATGSEWFRYNIDSSSRFAWTNDQRNGLALFLASIYEGVADLFAYYTLEKNDQSITLVKSLGINRQVSSPLFSTNVEKVYNLEAIEKQIATLTSQGCDEHPLCHYHLIGAIHAHAFEVIVSKFFELSNLVLNSREEQGLKLHFLKIWFEEIYLRANTKKIWQTSSTDSSFSAKRDFQKSISKIILESYFQSFEKFSQSKKTVHNTDFNLKTLCSVLNENYSALNVYQHKQCK